MHSLLTFYHSIPSSTWQVIGAALGLSSLLQALKHYFFKKLSPHAIMSITTVLAFLASALQYWVNAAKSNPTILGQHTAVLVGLMTLAYRYAVSPTYNLLLDAKTYRTNTQSANTTGSTTNLTINTNGVTTEASF